MTAVTSFAQSFLHLALARIGVGHRRGGLQPARALAHLRHLPARAARDRPLDLLARHPDRRRARDARRRLARPALRLAHRVPRGRPPRDRARPPRPLHGARAAARRGPHGARDGDSVVAPASCCACPRSSTSRRHRAPRLLRVRRGVLPSDLPGARARLELGEISTALAALALTRDGSAPTSAAGSPTGSPRATRAGTCGSPRSPRSSRSRSPPPSISGPSPDARSALRSRGRSSAASTSARASR